MRYFSIICLCYVGCQGTNNPTESLLFPDIIDVASSAVISANATCGKNNQEFYCKYMDYNDRRKPQCSVCDARSPDPSMRHEPQNIIDGTNSWWQSPSLAEGLDYEWVTVTLDLRQVYEVAYVIVKSAISPRPGNWILERSLDNFDFRPWQFYAISDSECNTFYNLDASSDRHRHKWGDDVLCTSTFSRLNPKEGGEIHTSLAGGPPKSGGFSKAQQDFVSARYVRFRFQKMQGKTSELDSELLRRYFYSMKDISIGGRCICNGHSDSCNIVQNRQKCSCSHNTCGSQCEQCCPLFNQLPWRLGTECQPCQCNDHADACRYDTEVHNNRLSLNAQGKYEGGGVCLSCRDFTAGLNCETCQAGFYRPKGVLANEDEPCVPCTCNSPGTTGSCVSDDTQANLGRDPGSCLCKQGFKGKTCEECAEGYLNFPRCDPCPCSRAGSKNKVCEGNCICKENVMGPRCDTCVPGTFHIDEFYELGCTACFCNGVTNKCEAARLAVYTISEKVRWQVSDLLQRRVIAAAESGASVSVAREDMSAYKAYFWIAPSDYLGKRLTAYGQTLTVKSSWVILRGDISGGATRCPDVIVEGGRFRISYGGQYYKGTTSVTFKIPFYEQGWYHFPKDLGDIPFHMALEDYRIRKVTREEMMEVLSEMKMLMIRARFHSEQVESILHDVILEYGKEGASKTKATLVTGAVEKCFCPPGYTGLSCELCAPGYRRIDNIINGGKCAACDCNGHVLSCDHFTGACGECLHNTVGDRCELCAPGYYGDATEGTPDDCKPCECPRPIGKNEFVPNCVSDPETGGFKCICPRGYEGLQCERCADGYFGNPMILGQPCRPCNCNGNVDPLARGNCDPFTGRCLKCLGNTAGFNCERCKENHYGDPKRGQCFECGCHEIGSVSRSCDPETGQCQCKPLYTGKQCDRCIPGRGGILERCPPCDCNPRGSVTTTCDPVTGICPCRPGVGGRHCNECLENHYGDIGVGCSQCNCDEVGSLRLACDLSTGQCVCKQNVVGRRCDKCRLGYWGLRSVGECRPCDCNPRGTIEGRCDPLTGECLCLPGIGGPNCDRCLPGYWGYSEQGCKPCEPCSFPGKNCDLNTGRCICPPNTEGDKCERCSRGFWEYSADIGCKPCRCSGPGSLERQCDPRTGQCVCRQGHEGDLCNKCSYGYYGYPNCRRCNCNPAGTDRTRCREEGTCQCDSNGQCPCKKYVRGISCTGCAEGTFGLSETNPLGCYECYCFRRSTNCGQADLTWSQLALPGEHRLKVGQSNTRLEMVNHLYVIPENEGEVTLGSSLPSMIPLYWQLPREFLRDKITSYNGYLRFKVETSGNRKSFPGEILQSYPLVSLQGNIQVVLEYYHTSLSVDGRYEVRLHEDFWRLKNEQRKVTRDEMMIALQNLQHILIRATHSDDFSSATLSEVTLDIAAEGTPISSRKAYGVEQCVCPPQYVGTSCQNPAAGYFRWFPPYVNHTTIIIIDVVVGKSVPCKCNGRADMCDRETGVCINCRENTAGDHCEVCISGYYGDPNVAPCRPCACPSRLQNFAKTCQSDHYSEYICHCREGYTGNKCERCASGYYGNPSEPGGSCRPCNCDPNGSIGQECDMNGNCRCRPGITGRFCSQCLPRHIVSENGCISCEDGCVDVLLDDIEALIQLVLSVDISGQIPSPWPTLNWIRNQTLILSAQLQRYESRVDISRNMLLKFDLDSKAAILLGECQRFKGNSEQNLRDVLKLIHEILTLLDEIRRIRLILEEAISYLENYAIGETPSISITAALDLAERILREIKLRNFVEYRQRALIELERAKALLERILRMEQSGKEVTILKTRFNEMNLKVDDLRNEVDDANRNVLQTKRLIEIIINKMNRVRSVLEKVNLIYVYTEDRNFNASRKVQMARRNIANVDLNFDNIGTLLVELEIKSTSLFEYVGRLWEFNSEYEIKVQIAEDHALYLAALAIQLDELFKTTRDVADGPLRAAEAYQRIIDALLAAEWAAKNASEAAFKAYKMAYPGNPEDSLVRKCKNSLEISKTLAISGEALLNKVFQLMKELMLQKKRLERTEQQILISNKIVISMNVLLNVLPFGISGEIEDVFHEAEKTDIKIEKTLLLIEEMFKNLTMMKTYAKKIVDFDASLFIEISNIISMVNTKTMSAQRLSTTLLHQSTRIEVRGNDLGDRIEALKRKIKQTRQHASSIRVSVTTDKNGVCTRKYRPHLQPSTTSRLTLGYAINSHHKHANLLYMGSSNASDFMAVKMIDRKIHLSWNAGGGSKTIIHPLPLETNSPSVSDETKWYHISINRIGNIGELSVRPAFIKGSRKQLYYEPVTGASPAGFSSMDLNPWDFVWMGGTPDGAGDGGYAGNYDFRGCLHYVTIDGEPLGLWNFTESIGCSACNEGFGLEAEDEDDTTFGFNGKGYFKGYNKIRRPKPFYSVVLSFRTLDENALLFLTYNKIKNQYASLSLNGGKVIFVVKFDNNTKLVIKSKKKYNINQLFHIQADVQVKARGGTRMGKLVIADQSELVTITGGPDLDLFEEPFYFGGVDPEFNNKLINGKVELRSLLGCMGGLSVMEIGKNPHTDGEYYGIDNSCHDEPLTDISFLGKGYVEMPSKVLQRNSNFGFSFKTKSSDALLMVSTFIGQRRSGANPPDFYTVSLSGGSLDLRMFAGSKRHHMISRKRYDDGVFHSFLVIKENRRVKLFVDDELVNSTTLDKRSQVIEAPSSGGLFFGGVPYDFNLREMVGSSLPLSGCIQDVVINDDIVAFNEPTRFRKAFIGRCAERIKSTSGGSKEKAWVGLIEF